MRPKNDQIAVLRRLRREGQISEAEFEDLAGGLVGRAPEGTEPQDPVGESPRDELEPEPDDRNRETQGDDPEADGNEATRDEDLEPMDPLLPPRLRANLSANYVGGLAVAALGLIALSSMGILSWLVTIPAVLLMATTLLDGWRAVTVIGVLVWGALLLVGLAFSVAGNAQAEPVVAATVPRQDPDPPIPGSLGIYMDELTEKWNTVDTPPQITKGLTRYNEIGEYDTFIYRFGGWGRVAGAFDPENQAIYALLITGQFSAEDTDQLYLHLCFVVAPYSQECIDSYRDVGLKGGTLDDFADLTHEAEWTLEDQTWRLEIAGNVMTVRVYGPDAA